MMLEKHPPFGYSPESRDVATMKLGRRGWPGVVALPRLIGVWTKPLARRTLRIRLARSAG
jgi:hypothetical protein